MTQVLYVTGYKSKYHDKFIQLGDVFPFCVAVEQQSCVVFCSHLCLVKGFKIRGEIVDTLCVKKLVTTKVANAKGTFVQHEHTFTLY